MKRIATALVVLSLLTVVPGIVPRTVSAGPAADAIAALELEVAQNNSDIATLRAQVAELEARPWPSPTASPLSSGTPLPTVSPSFTASPTASPSPTAPAPSSIAPTSTPFITPTPSIGPSPTASSGTSVPASIDATGATDVSAALNTWIASVPDGSTVLFKAGGTYRLSQGIQIAGRHNLTFEGNGATLRTTGSGSDQLASLFVIGHRYGGAWAGGNSNIVVRDFVLVGNDPTPGTFGGGEAQAGMEIEGVSGLEVANVTVQAVYGDGFKVGDASTNVVIHDVHVQTAGRNGVSVIYGSRVTVRDSAFDRVGYVTFDVEPNTSTQPSSGLLFTANTAGTWGAEFFALDGSHTGASINDVTVSGNRVTGAGLLTFVDNGNTGRNRNITFTDNQGATAARLTFRHVDGLVIGGNSPATYSIDDCTQVVGP